MSQGFWMPKGGGESNDDDMAYGSNSRLETKRSHQWFMDGPEADLVPHKKQALEITNNNSFLELLNSSSSQWGVSSGFQPASGHFGEQLFDPESSRMINYDERGIPSVSSGKMNMGRKVHEEDLLLNDSSFALSMSHMSEDPGLHYGGARKVKVSQVKGSEHGIPVSMGHGYNKMESSHLFAPHAFVKNDENHISLALPSGVGLGADSIVTLGHTNGGESSGITMGKPHGIEDESASIGQTYREDDNNMPISHMMRKERNNLTAIGQGYQSDGCTMSINHMYNKEVNSSSLSVGNSYDKAENAMGHAFGKGQSTIISFGGCDDDTNSSGRLIYNYEMLMGQPSLQMPDAIGNMGLVNSNGDAQIFVPGVGNNSKKKEEHNVTKKPPSNNFPSNVRSLLSTGILDGVHVKYIAWSREKELRGIIRGSGYLCGCPSCNYTKVINAYEFERHAGCKTKHPNNHIYFENGKTIYGTVQELRSTPQHMLFEVMQTITGSPINQKSFRLWKESYLAATRELQRIYGKDDGRVLS